MLSNAPVSDLTNAPTEPETSENTVASVIHSSIISTGYEMEHSKPTQQPGVPETQGITVATVEISSTREVEGLTEKGSSPPSMETSQGPQLPEASVSEQVQHELSSGTTYSSTPSQEFSETSKEIEVFTSAKVVTNENGSSPPLVETSQGVTSGLTEISEIEPSTGMNQSGPSTLLAESPAKGISVSESVSPGASTHQSTTVLENVTLTSSEIHIDLPIYLPNSSVTPESFLKFYSSDMRTIIVDDEATDSTIGEEFKNMDVEDFHVITEFPVTIGEDEEVEGNAKHILQKLAKPSIKTYSNETSPSEISAKISTPSHEDEVASGKPMPSEESVTQTSSYETTIAATPSGKAEESTTQTCSVTPTNIGKSEETQALKADSIIPQDLQSEYIPNGCTASDFESGSGCFCLIDEMLKSLRVSARDKNLTRKVDSYKCGSFFKVKEGILINNETVENREKRSYSFFKNQQQIAVAKREIVPHNEIENMLKITTNIQNTGTMVAIKPRFFNESAFYSRHQDLCCARIQSNHTVYELRSIRTQSRLQIHLDFFRRKTTYR